MSETNWPDPTPEMLTDPRFEAVWQCIKRWDINRFGSGPEGDGQYSAATGNHVRAILDALSAAPPSTDQRLREENDALKREVVELKNRRDVLKGVCDDLGYVLSQRETRIEEVTAEREMRAGERDALTRQHEADLRVVDALNDACEAATQREETAIVERDALTRRVEGLEKRANEGYAAHAASFGALVDIAMLLNLDGVDEYDAVVAAVRRIVDENAVRHPPRG